mmetsp:Transcript_120139/g.351125  ORF Transcript_120139/g.351125 Transcript_120139/m.351125 type:complete len:80 (-) Transcript_120139:296-535(-)
MSKLAALKEKAKLLERLVDACRPTMGQPSKIEAAARERKTPRATPPAVAPWNADARGHLAAGATPGPPEGPALLLDAFP